MGIFGIVFGFVALVFLVHGFNKFRAALHRRKLRSMGNQQTGIITAIVNSGFRSGKNPDLRITVTYRGYPRQFTLNFNIARLPRLGDHIHIWVNPNDPSDFSPADNKPVPPDFQQ